MQPEPISSIIRRILSGRGLMGGIEEAEVVGRWAEIVGESLANQTEAVAIEHKILFVRVDDSAWRNELSLMKEDIVEKINDFFGNERVSRIHLL